MIYLLDSDMCIYIIRQNFSAVQARFGQYSYGQVGVSSITVGELTYGAERSKDVERSHRALSNFLLPLTIALFDERAAYIFGEIRVYLERKGLMIGPYDLLIAAHALALDVTLVTNNTREFQRVADLRIENWTL